MTKANIVGVDPHRKTFTATLLDLRGGEIDHAHFTNNCDGHAAAPVSYTHLVWALVVPLDEVLKAEEPGSTGGLSEFWKDVKAS